MCTCLCIKKFLFYLFCSPLTARITIRTKQFASRVQMAVFNEKKNPWYTCEFLTFLSCFKMQKCVWSTFLFYGRRVLHAWGGLLLYTGRRDVKWRRPQILKVSGHMMSPASSVKLAEISRHDWCQLDDPAASPWVVNTWTASKFAQGSNSSCEDVERRMKNVPCCYLLCSSGYISTDIHTFMPKGQHVTDITLH